MAGCDASGTDYGANIPPYMPDFPTLIAEYLKRKYKTEINCINTSVGGMNTRWGVRELKGKSFGLFPRYRIYRFRHERPRHGQKRL